MAKSDVKGQYYARYRNFGLKSNTGKGRATNAGGSRACARIRNVFEPPQEVGEHVSDMLFADCLLQWLDIVKVRVKANTYDSYEQITKSVIEPYFRKKAVTLQVTEARHIRQFYSEKLKNVKENSVNLCSKCGDFSSDDEKD